VIIKITAETQMKDNVAIAKYVFGYRYIATVPTKQQPK